MAEDETKPPPQISVSRTSSVSNEAALPPQDNRDKAKRRPKVYTHNAWNPQPWYYGTHTQSWKRHMQNTDLEWKTKWTKDCFATGRVLIIDYISNNAAETSACDTGKRHIAVAAQEFENLKSLKRFYADKERVHSAALRVIHVQNARWATDFLLRKFNIDHDSDMIGMSGFSKWAKYDGPLMRGGKPFPNGRSWREQTDPWRSISRTAFGLDYLKVFRTPDPKQPRTQNVFGDKPMDAQMMHLNTYPDNERSPFGYDVSVQRLNVYVQRSLGPASQVSPQDENRSPYVRHAANGGWAKGDEGKIDPNFLDNSSTVIVFETSASLLLEDCLVQPRNELETRWRRLSFYLRKDVARDDARLAAQCTNMILGDIFHGLAIVWQSFLAAGATHVNILEDKIYENPADESRAPELWTNQAAWLKVDKVMFIHQDLVKEMQGHLHDLASVEVEDDPQTQLGQLEWLSSTPAEYERLAHSVNEDLVQPTTNLSDLMYKSVGIRDSRQSLQLGLSMWRLSWITFIFLPLTFLVSFFGMNVDTFNEGDPSILWYFVSAIVMMVFVLLLWYCVKHSLQRRRQTPYQRGVYEHLFNDLENDYPLMWTRDGAVEDLEPDGFVNQLKWRLLKQWFAPDKTINKQLYQSLGMHDDDSDLGSWARCKRFLLRRWLPTIRLKRRPGDDIAMIQVVEPESSASAPASLRYEPGTISALAKMSTPVAMADGEPAAVQQISTMGLRPLNVMEGRRPRSSVSSEGRSYSEERPSSRGSSGIMFEERNMSDSESDVGEGASSSKDGEQTRPASN